MTDSSLQAALRAGAEGLYAPEAGAGPLIAHGAWPGREDFGRFIRTGDSLTNPGTELAAVDWEAAIIALDAGEFPSSSGEKRMFRFAAGLAGDIPVQLGSVVTGIDDRNVGLLVKVISTSFLASGRPLRRCYTRRWIPRGHQYCSRSWPSRHSAELAVLTWERVTRFPASSTTWSKPSGRSTDACTARTREMTLSRTVRVRRELRPGAVSCGGTGADWCRGPAQNSAGVTPASRAAFPTAAGSARPSSERSTRSVPPRGPRNTACTPSSPRLENPHEPSCATNSRQVGCGPAKSRVSIGSGMVMTPSRTCATCVTSTAFRITLSIGSCGRLSQKRMPSQVTAGCDHAHSATGAAVSAM